MEQRKKRTQRDYTLAFKIAVVSETIETESTALCSEPGKRISKITANVYAANRHTQVVLFAAG